jgi:hypothetical protein
MLQFKLIFYYLKTCSEGCFKGVKHVLVKSLRLSVCALQLNCGKLNIDSVITHLKVKACHEIICVILSLTQHCIKTSPYNRFHLYVLNTVKLRKYVCYGIDKSRS